MTEKERARLDKIIEHALHDGGVSEEARTTAVMALKLIVVEYKLLPPAACGALPPALDDVAPWAYPRYRPVSRRTPYRERITFRGWCADCRSTIEPGSEIRYKNDRRVHWACAR